MKNKTNPQLLDLPISQIKPNPNQPRKTFPKESLLDLAQTIKEHGLIQPIVVEDQGGGGYLLVSGERRYRASKLAGCATIMAYIRNRTNHNGREILLHGIIENVQREDMNPIDEGLAFNELATTHQMSAYEIAHKLGINAKRVYDHLKLLKLQVRVQELIRAGRMSHDPRLTDALLKIPDPEQQILLAEKIVSERIQIKRAIKIAENLCDLLVSHPLLKKGATVKAAFSTKTIPALRLARYATQDEEKKPPRWDALAQVGKLPKWELVVLTARATCAECELRDMASNETCNRCPAVMLIEHMLKEVKG